MTFTHCPPVEFADLVSETFPDGKRYYTTPDGVRLPSVTTVIGAKKKESIQRWRQRVGEEEANKVSRKASSRGTQVHSLCEQYLNNESPDFSKVTADETKLMFKSIKPLMDRISNVWYQEQALWSKQLGMAGRCDVIAEFDGKLSIIDFKTSTRVKGKSDIPDYFAQCTAYAMMLEEMLIDKMQVNVEQIVIIMAVDGNKPLLFIEKTADHIDSLAEHIHFYNTVV